MADEKMNICMVISTPFPPEEGIGNYVYGLSKQLCNKGCKITIITRGLFHQIRKENIDGIDIIKVPFIPFYPLHIYIHGVFVNSYFKKIESKFDIVHIHSPLTPLIKTFLPIIATIHTPMLADTQSRYDEKAGLYAVLEKIMGKYVSYYIESDLIKRADVITTVANSVVNDLKEYNIDSSTLNVVGNGVDETIFTPLNNKPKEKFILYTGRLDYRKGLFDLVESSKYILKNHPDVSFIICGKGILFNKLLKKVEEIGLREKFRFLGFISRDRLISLFQNATVYVMPSHYEGLPTVLLEAMACGCPVVASSVSGNIDVVTSGKNGILVPPKSPKEIAKAVSMLLDNKHMREKLGVNARKTIEDHFTWDVISNKFLKCYESML